MYIYLIFLNANDLLLNDWPPECVFPDTYPNQLLRSNHHLPMVSVMVNSIGGVDIYISHELATSLFCSETLTSNWKTAQHPQQTIIHPSRITTSVSPDLYLHEQWTYLFAWACTYCMKVTSSSRRPETPRSSRDFRKSFFVFNEQILTS